MRSAIKSYYWGGSRLYSDITVNRTMYDSNGTNTTNSTAATKYVYYVVLKKLIPSVSTVQVLVSKNTTATVTFDVPSTVIRSSEPITGYFKIRCPTSDGASFSESENIWFGWGDRTI